MSLTGSASVTNELQGSVESGGEVRGKLSGLEFIQGKSAFEVAVMNGFSGTEEEWLASLKGDPGMPGPPGAKGEDGSVVFEELTDEQKELLKGKDGEPGKDGYTPVKGVDYFDGEQGPPGVSGVYVGTGDMPEGYNVQVDPDGEALEIPPAPKLMTAEEFDAVTDWNAVLGEGEIAWRCG